MLWQKGGIWQITVYMFNKGQLHRKWFCRQHLIVIKTCHCFFEGFFLFVFLYEVLACSLLNVCVFDFVRPRLRQSWTDTGKDFFKG